MTKSKRPHSEAFASSSSTNQDNAPAGQEPAAAAPASNSNEENPFKDCVIAICGHHEPWKTAILKEMVTRTSAQNSRIVKKTTTHLVTTETEVNANAKQVARARGNPTCSIVSLQWLLDSEKAGTPLPVEPYRLDTATAATPSPARNADVPSDNPTPAAQQQDTGNTIESPGIHEHLLTFQVNLAQPGSGAQNVEEHDDINASERPTKKRRIRRADLEAEHDDQVETFADDTVAVSEAQPATPLGQPHTGAAARQTHVEQATDSQRDAETEYDHEADNHHLAAPNARNMVPVTTAQDLIRNGQCPANYPAPEQQAESASARDRLLPIPSYARSIWIKFHAVWSGDYSALELEAEGPRGDQQILYYDPAAGEPIEMPGYIDPEYASALTWVSGNGRQ